MIPHAASIHTRYGPPSIRLPSLPAIPFPSLSLDGLVKGRPSLSKDRHAILMTGEVFLREKVCVWCKMGGNFGVDGLALQGVVFGDIAVILALIEAQTDLYPALIQRSRAARSQ